MSEQHQLGDATLELVADECTLAILRELSRGPLCADEIEACAPGIARWTTRRRLRTLADSGFVRAAHESERSRGYGRSVVWRARCELTELGSECLLALIAAAERCERMWRLPPNRHDATGLWALGLASDRPTRAIARALADGPRGPADLRVRLPDLRRSTFMRRLKALSEDGVLVRSEHAGEVLYALADSARHLAILPLRAAQCEWRRASRPDRARAGDLPGLLCVLAPLVRIPQDASGACGWHLDSKTTLEADIYLTATSGRVAVLSVAPTSAPQAVGHATPTVWGEALLHGDRSGIVTSGDERLFNAVFSGMSSALLA